MDEQWEGDGEHWEEDHNEDEEEDPNTPSEPEIVEDPPTVGETWFTAFQEENNKDDAFGQDFQNNFHARFVEQRAELERERQIAAERVAREEALWRQLQERLADRVRNRRAHGRCEDPYWRLQPHSAECQVCMRLMPLYIHHCSGGCGMQVCGFCSRRLPDVLWLEGDERQAIGELAATDEGEATDREDSNGLAAAIEDENAPGEVENLVETQTTDEGESTRANQRARSRILVTPSRRGDRFHKQDRERGDGDRNRARKQGGQKRWDHSADMAPCRG